MYLVDTDIVSTGAPQPRPEALVVAGWMDQHSDLLFLPVIAVAEIEEGIAKLRRQGGTRRADGLAEWLDAVLHLYHERILVLDLAAARAAGALRDRARAAGIAPGFADLAVAAIAQVNGLTILTRNARHFAPLGVVHLDPFATLPS